MNYKQILCIVLGLFGLLCTYTAGTYLSKLAEAHGTIQETKDFFSHNPTWNPIVTFFGGKAVEKVSSYNFAVICLLMFGILSVMLAVLGLLYYRSKKR